jgi:hypothetical protein
MPSQHEAGLLGDWSGFRGAEYHLAFALWLLLTEQIKWIRFYDSNDLRAAMPPELAGTREGNLVSFHPANMAPIAVAMLATLAGMFVILDSRAGDRRLALAGLRLGGLLAARLALVALAALAATVVSLAFTAAVSEIHQWFIYAGGVALIAVTYGLIGVILAPVFGRVAGVYIAFLIPFLDIGLTQSPMLHPVLPAWARFLPGYGGSRVLIDGAISNVFNQSGALLFGLGWLVVLTAAAVLLFGSSTHTGRASRSRV